jgi:hypothetical protein
VFSTQFSPLAHTDRYHVSIIFLNTPDRPDFKRTDWSKYQAWLDNVIPFNAETEDEAGIDACVGSLTSAISRALEVSTPKSRLRADPRQPILARIQDEIRLKNRLMRQWQLTRDPALKAGVNRLQRSVTLQLQEWRNDQWSDTLEALHPEGQSQWRMTKRVMRVTTPTPPLVTPGGVALSDSKQPKVSLGDETCAKRKKTSPRLFSHCCV